MTRTWSVPLQQLPPSLQEHSPSQPVLLQATNNQACMHELGGHSTMYDPVRMLPLKSSCPCINSAHKPSGAGCTKNLLAAWWGPTDSLPSLQQVGPVQTPPLHTQGAAHTPLRCLGECQARLGLLTGQLHICDHLQLLHGCNDVPSDVHLPPLQAVARAGLKRMVVVVPALTPSQQTNPPAKQHGQQAHSRCHSSTPACQHTDSRPQKNPRQASTPTGRNHKQLHGNPAGSSHPPASQNSVPRPELLLPLVRLTSCCGRGRPCCRSVCPSSVPRC